MEAMTESGCRRHRVGYCISVASALFSSQADHSCALQLSHLLHEQGVSGEDIFIWLPTEHGVTVEEPRGCLVGPRLQVPSGYEARVVRDNGKVSGIRMPEFDVFFNRTDLDGIVWFFLDHVNRNPVMLVDGAMLMSSFLLSLKQPKWSSKNVLVILDSYSSGAFAKSAMLPDRGDEYHCGAPARTLILTSSPTVCRTSSVIISDDISLLNTYTDPNSGVSVNYSIQSSMMMRQLLHLIAYTDENPELTDLADLLNGDFSRGFKAECHKNDVIFAGLHLRDFFGGSVNPDKLVSIGDEEYAFRLILPPVSPGGLFDDFAVCGGCVDDEEDDFCFVEVIRGENGGVEVIDVGKLDARNAVHELIIGQLLNDKSKKPEPVRIRMRTLVETTISQVKSPPIIPLGEMTKEVLEIYSTVKGINGRTRNRYETGSIRKFLRYWHLFSVDEWCTRILEAHDTVTDLCTPDFCMYF
jgi:hypothetical protein